MEWPAEQVSLKDEGYEDFIGRYPAVVVDFWGPSCAPCKMIAPILDQLSAELKGKVAFAKMDVTKNMRTHTKVGVKSLPTLAFYKDGKLVKKKSGFIPKPRLVGEIREIL